MDRIDESEDKVVLVGFLARVQRGGAETAGNARTVFTISSDHEVNSAERPGLTVRAMVTVTLPGAMRGSFSVSNGPVSSDTKIR